MTEDSAPGNSAGTTDELLVQANSQVVLMAALADFTSALNASVDLDDAVASAAGFVRQIFGLDHLALIVVGPQADLMGMRTDETQPGQIEHFAVSGEEKLLLQAFTTGETTFRSEGEDLEGVAEILANDNIKSVVVMPLMSAAGLVGAMLAGSTTVDDATQYGGGVLKNASEEVATALERAVSFEKSRMQAITDPLTELYNRRYFVEALRNEVRKANRLGYPLGLFMIDIDHFKLVNDTYGHMAGDEVLTRVARTIERSVRASDVVAWYGGEEFAVILVGCPPVALTALAEKTREAVASADMPHMSEDGRGMTISVGAVAYEDMTMDAEAFVNCADQALLLAKSSGRDRVVVGDSMAV